ncbi:Hypothetical protein NTJ_16268 [Nesidiocoris tenuis]|uniref:Cilia- and flagella-associated protein 126 n=1 Tax=Nesidiocoris tenuis TaxID=355587 RepID=A0ABN7BGE9_9HEMI|nr:Hypothetical protein NTJ_16268 [Nesidiocoris tenuis]
MAENGKRRYQLRRESIVFEGGKRVTWCRYYGGFSCLATTARCAHPRRQFERSFQPERLGNWQVPKKYPHERPRARRGHTKVIANDRGHLLPGVPRIEPWNQFTSTWQLPKRITRKVARDVNTLRPTGKHLTSWEKRSYHVPIYDRNIPPGLPSTKKEKRQSSAKKEIPIVDDPPTGPREDYDPYKKDEHDYSLPMGADRNPKNINTAERVREDIKGYLEASRPDSPGKKLEMNHGAAVLSSRRSSRSSRSGSVTPKEPGLDSEKHVSDGEYLSPQYAKGLAQDNLKHQPLPDTVTHQAFKTLQMKREKSPGLAIPEVTKAAAVGAQKFVSPGPTQCSKMMVYRPRTAGNKASSPEPLIEPPKFSRKKDLNPIDLAICWDIVLDKVDEPKKPIHIDGGTDTAGPSVFTLVHRPPSDDGSPSNSRRHSSSTSRRKGRKDEDNVRNLLRVKKGWEDKTVNPSAVMDIINNNNSEVTEKVGEKVRKSDRKDSAQSSDHSKGKDSARSRRRSASSVRGSDGSIENQNPNVPQNKSNGACSGSNCGTDKNSGSSIRDAIRNSLESSVDSEKLAKLRHYRSSPNLTTAGAENLKSKQKMMFSRPCMACETKDHKESTCDKRPKSDYKMAFKAGIPNSNNSNKSDSTGSRPHTAKPLSIPKPRTPYAKRSYSINTLAPPFALWPGTTGMDYPEHWRLASVYQHSYKPVELRKRPLLQSVYH